MTDLLFLFACILTLGGLALFSTLQWKHSDKEKERLAGLLENAMVRGKHGRLEKYKHP